MLRLLQVLVSQLIAQIHRISRSDFLGCDENSIAGQAKNSYHDEEPKRGISSLFEAGIDG